MLWLLLACTSEPAAPPQVAPPQVAHETAPAPAAPAPIAQPVVKDKPAPTRDFGGLQLGATDGPALERWLESKGLSCPEAQSSRRMTLRRTCEGPLDADILPPRGAVGVLTSLLVARPDEGPVHHVSTVRKHSAPQDAVATYDASVAALTEALGPPTRAAAVDLEALKRPLARASSAWTFDDLEVTVSLMKAAGSAISVNEIWSVPGIEDQVAQRGEGSLHGNKTPSAPVNPHLAGGSPHPGWDTTAGP